MAKSFKPGQLNPLTFPGRAPLATPDIITDNSMAVYNKSIGNLMSPNILEGVTEFTAQVLLSFEEPPQSSPLFELVKSVVGITTAENVSYCVCRIPEIHQYILDPNEAKDAASKIALTELHPIFEVRPSLLNITITPGPGSIVKVKFVDSSYRYGEVTSIILNTDPESVEETLTAKGFMDAGAGSRIVSPQSPFGLPHGEEKTDWKGIEVHYTVTKNAEDAIYILQRRGLSYHYIIDKDGTQTMVIDPNYIAYHGGENNWKNIGISLVNLGYDKAGANNVGVTTDNWVRVLPGARGTWDPYPGQQIKSMVELVEQLKYNYPTIQYISGHEDNSASKSDPGPLFDPHWDKFGLERGPNPASVKNRAMQAQLDPDTPGDMHMEYGTSSTDDFAAAVREYLDELDADEASPP